MRNKTFKPAPYLAKYNTLIFDMDGVITSEESYWDAAALTVCEMTGGAADARRVREIRADIFYGDRLIRLLKEKGVNSNWDLAYLVFAFMLKYGGGREIYYGLKDTGMRAFELYGKAADILAGSLGRPREETCRGGGIWLLVQDIFQEWYLGSGQYFEVYGKKGRNGNKEGLLGDEKPLIELSRLKSLLEALCKDGKRLCIGTGRPGAEIYAPLIKWEIYKYFDGNGIINYDDVLNAERVTGRPGLTKPHPYMFIKAYLGRDYRDEEIVRDDFEKRFSDCLVVGDAGADILAAHAMGADFAAVLTGISGKRGREYFAEQNAAYILDDVTGLTVEA